MQGGRAIALLNALIGTLDQPGGVAIPERHGPKFTAAKPGPDAADTLEQPRFDQLETYPLGHSPGVYAQTFTNLLDGTGPYEPKMMVCVFQNPVMAVPGRPNIEQALAKLDTLVVIDTMLSETAMLADYVLPGTVYLERYDLTVHWVTWSAIGLPNPSCRRCSASPPKVGRRWRSVPRTCPERRSNAGRTWHLVATPGHTRPGRKRR